VELDEKEGRKNKSPFISASFMTTAGRKAGKEKPFLSNLDRRELHGYGR